MKYASFHHPDISWTVVGRKASLEWLSFLGFCGRAMMTRDRCMLWNYSYPNQAAYHSAMYRLKKKGLIAYRRTGGRSAVLKITDEGLRKLPDYCRPHSFWKKKWKGRWYVLMYDVPELERPYREALRGFLQRMRMGQLQRSVWISARDIRPEFDDLQEAADIESYAVLMESQNVLGRSDLEIANMAWSLEKLGSIQYKYLEVYTSNLALLTNGRLSLSQIMQMAREENQVFREIMERDPLLPMSLYPEPYFGPQVHDLHARLIQAVAERNEQAE